MFELVHAGFDTLDIAIQGSLPPDVLSALDKARDTASETQAPFLTTIGPGKVSMHVNGHGMRGGYAYVTDTGPLGAIWKLKKNADPTQWNIFVSPRATTLLSHGFAGTLDYIFETLEAMGATVSGHSVNRVDIALDFKTENFELHLDQFVAHAHTKVQPYWGEETHKAEKNQPSAILRGRQLESVTVGKQPGRQIIVYDKKREAIARQKHFWFKAWDVDQHDQSVNVWRVEIRAGKKALKERWQIRQLEDVDASIGDVCLHALSDVRYLADQQSDSNVTRQELHPLWIATQGAVTERLAEFRSGLLPGQIIEIERELAQERYVKLVTSNAIGLGVALGLKDDAILADLSVIVSDNVKAAVDADEGRISKSIKRARERLHFVCAE